MKIKLRTKAIIAIFLVALILCSVALYVSYKVHARTMDKHYKQLARNIAETTALVVDKEIISEYTDAVKEIYLNNPRPEFDSATEEELYFKQYENVLDERYNEIFEHINNIKKTNVVKSLYVIF